MKTKPKKSNRKTPSAKLRPWPRLSEAEVEAFVVDEADSLNASIKKARAEVKKGIHSARSVKNIAADGVKRLKTNATRAAR